MRVLRFGATLALAISAACAGRSPSSPQPRGDAQLRVENRTFSDAVIYVLKGGQRMRIGLAGSMSTTTMTIPAALITPGQPLQFLANPIGSPREAVSQELSVQPGDVVGLTIPPHP